MLIPVIYRHRRFGSEWYGFLDELNGLYCVVDSPRAAEVALRDKTLHWKPLDQLDSWTWEVTRLRRVD